jgi:hypothetical protein
MNPMSGQDARNKPPDDDLAEVARVYGPFEADLIKNFLESHGIASIVRGRMAPFVYPKRTGKRPRSSSPPCPHPTMKTTRKSPADRVHRPPPQPLALIT